MNMKKFITFLTVTLPLYAFTQRTLDSVQVSLTLRAQDWAWCVGRFGDGVDSASRAEIRNVRSQLITLNPPTWTSNATITSVSGNLVIAFYSFYSYAGFGEAQAMGNTNAEKTTIYTNIRAIADTIVQKHIAIVDQNLANQYTNTRKVGKSILLDNSGGTQTALSRIPIAPIIIIKPIRPNRN
jgi:hypothetical protein